MFTTLAMVWGPTLYHIWDNDTLGNYEALANIANHGILVEFGHLLPIHPGETGIKKAVAEPAEPAPAPCFRVSNVPLHGPAPGQDGASE